MWAPPVTKWTLPFGADILRRGVSVSEDFARKEFERLDVVGDGRITLLNLRAALQAQRVPVDEETVRRWMRETDRGSKGYVDMGDYLAIYGIVRSNSRYDQSRGSATFRMTTTGGSSSSGAMSTGKSPRVDAANRLEVLQQAFARYDVDSDGLISLKDLQAAFAAQGRQCSRQDLETWLAKRDLSGRGAVSFEDFAKHYK